MKGGKWSVLLNICLVNLDITLLKLVLTWKTEKN